MASTSISSAYNRAIANPSPLSFVPLSFTTEPPPPLLEHELERSRGDRASMPLPRAVAAAADLPKHYEDAHEPPRRHLLRLRYQIERRNSRALAIAVVFIGYIVGVRRRFQLLRSVPGYPNHVPEFAVIANI
ncbi:uncharacterized protein LOC119330456 [Triticum dicoccoides]|uniref:uncharacterized protein LOC119330456 n=1 Tax=Triticum dicoccoides TaxID=85692 RepID=UPI00189137F8|nr:uncharacterized protein LOC119330456 [Triticum dicoccoides]XP_044427279.1 uncharacterized protein LOC123151676 [Triticum aestivum]